MIRISLENVIRIGSAGCIHNFDNQVVVFKTAKGIVTDTNRREEMEFDSFLFAYVEKGTASVNINGQMYKLDDRSMCIVTPSHASILCELSPDLTVTFVLIKQTDTQTSFIRRTANSAEMWVYLYFHPVIRINDEEKRNLQDSVNYLSSQIDRPVFEDKSEFIANAVSRLNLETDHILKVRQQLQGKEEPALMHRERIVQSLVVLVTQNFKTEHKASFYADKMCYSLQYLNLLSNELIGLTVSEIIARFLYSTARNMLLNTDMTIQEISIELHFADQATFSKFFKKMCGKSPKEARRDGAANPLLASLH